MVSTVVFHYPSCKLFFNNAYPSLKSNLPPIALGMHGSGHLAESCYVASSHQTGELSFGRLDVLLGGLQAILKARFHDTLELAVNFLSAPSDALAILSHFQTGDRDTSGVCCLTCNED